MAMETRGIQGHVAMKPSSLRRFLPLLLALGSLLGPASSRADRFLFQWWLLTGDFDDTGAYVDLDGDPVPLKVWGAIGVAQEARPEDFPLIVEWLEENYGTRDVFDVEFRVGTADTSEAHAMELDTGSFTKDVAAGLASMTYLPAVGTSVPVEWWVRAEDADGGNRVEQKIASGTMSAMRLRQSARLGYSGYGEFTLDADEGAVGPVTMEPCPFYDEVAALVGGTGPSYPFEIVIGEFEEDAEAQADWEAEHPSGQVEDATIFVTTGLGFVGEPSGVIQSSPFLPDNPTFDQGRWEFLASQLPQLGAWFDPPLVSEYRYLTTDSRFTAVGLPTGIDTEDGTFVVVHAGRRTTVAEGAFFVFPTPVTEFRIQDIEGPVDSADSVAFPVQLAFTTASPTVYIQPDPRERDETTLAALAKEFEIGEAVDIDLSGLSLLPGDTVSVTGLPAGVVFDRNTLRLGGTVLGPGSEGGVRVWVRRGTATLRSSAFDLAVEPFRYAGTYELLIENPGGDPLGKIRLTVSNPTPGNPLATFSATLDRPAEPRRVARGSFLPAQSPTQEVALCFCQLLTYPQVDFTVTLTHGSDDVSGEQDAGSDNTARGFRVARTERVPGGIPRVTMAFVPTVPGDRTNVPAGFGWVTGTRNSNALLSARGLLGDAQPVTFGLSLSPGQEAVLWLTPYRNKTSYFGGIVSGPSTNGLRWYRAADAVATSYPAGFSQQTLDVNGSEWEVPASAAGMAATLDLDFRRLHLAYGARPDGVVLPSLWSLRDRYSLVAMAPSNAVPWRGSVNRALGTFGGNLTLPVPAARTSVSGVFLQDSPGGDVVGYGLVRIPIPGPVRGSFQTAGIGVTRVMPAP
jgi:hypothetical protein